ncbi:MAG: TetR/AcrR family transcriptional regulator [Actinomycetota bacterium]
MDLEPPQKRRRGAELEDALLDAALVELSEKGYGDFTVEGVAERAGTSRHVIYRRWPTRPDLVLAALRKNAHDDARPVPDTGSLRGDVLELLTAANRSRLGLAAMLSVQLGAYFQETGTTLGEVRRAILGDRPSAMVTVMKRAADRGEIDPSRITTRMTTLAVDLLRHDALMSLGRVPDSVIVEIVDDIFLPLVLAKK